MLRGGGEMKRTVEEVTLQDEGITEGHGRAGGRMKRSWRDNGRVEGH